MGGWNESEVWQGHIWASGPCRSLLFSRLSVSGQLGSLDSEGSGQGKGSRGPTCTPVCPSLSVCPSFSFCSFIPTLEEERQGFLEGKGRRRVKLRAPLGGRGPGDSVWTMSLQSHTNPDECGISCWKPAGRPSFHRIVSAFGRLKLFDRVPLLNSRRISEVCPVSPAGDFWQSKLVRVASLSFKGKLYCIFLKKHV